MYMKKYDVKVNKSEEEYYCEGKSGCSVNVTADYIHCIIIFFISFLIMIYLITFPY